MEAEQSQNFNERLNQWVASQGFWFQVRYSMAGSGAKGTAMFHLISMGFRLLIFLVVVALGFWVYLIKREGGESYREAFRETLEAGLSATDSQMTNYSQTRGNQSISLLACEGGDDAFFASMEARNIRFRKGVLDGFSKSWDPGTIAISRLEMELKAGANDPEGAAKIAAAYFRQFPKANLSRFDVADATLRWGYSERTRGMIEGSKLAILRTEGMIKMTFQGGTFTQNWLRKLDIVNLIVVCDRESIFFEKAEFRRGSGTVDFTGLKVLGGERPALSGRAKIRKLSLEHIVPPALRSFVEGSISGDFEVFGSTNTSEGVGFKGTVELDGQDVITLRERLHLLKALSVVDYSRTYHRVDFREGAFHLETGSGGLEIKNLDLVAEDVTLKGSMRVRMPTAEEAQSLIQRNSTETAPIFASEESDLTIRERSGDSTDFTLKRAALEAKRIKDGKQTEESVSLLERIGLGQEMRFLEEQAAERLSRTLRYEGSFRITLPPDAFERTPELSAQFPIDPETKRIPLMVPIEGSIYEVTLKQAEDLYQQGRR